MVFLNLSRSICNFIALLVGEWVNVVQSLSTDYES